MGLTLLKARIGKVVVIAGAPLQSAHGLLLQWFALRLFADITVQFCPASRP
jgi:hypothetical protein